ncbi:MAG: hypothetical protein KatS3mg121_1020 [Gammaproteobacteria bacterium]|nr:MAG: hypothetical protein KatS3mg121_1020 [Gammaproteobacteria bacterium]
MPIDLVVPSASSMAGRRRGRSAARTGRSGSPWAGPGRSSSCARTPSASTISAPSARPNLIAMCTAARLSTGNTPGRPRSTAQAWVFGRRTVGGGGARENLAPGGELDVHLQADDGLPVHQPSPSPANAGGSRRCQSVALLVAVGGAEQARLVEGAADQLQPHRQAGGGEAGGHGHRRQARQVDGDGVDVRQIHRHRIARLLAEGEGGAGRGRPGDQVHRLEGARGNPRRSAGARCCALR